MSYDYTSTFEVSAPPEQVFRAITEQIDLWWTTKSNQAKTVNDRLRVEFIGDTFKEIEITDAIPANLLTWNVLGAHLGHEELEKKDEWVNTEIRWEINPTNNGSSITLQHRGLTPELECWDVCNHGWNHFLGSLKALLDTGKGTPYTVQN